MVQSTTLQKFPHVHDDPASLPRSLDPFTITTSTGFLPYATSPTTLPEVFKPLLSLLHRLPVVREDGAPGLLGEYKLGPAVLAELPDLTAHIEDIVTPAGDKDLFTITALFRDYSFLASAYLLEPAWENWTKNPDGGYGIGREVLPRSVAGPMCRCAELYVLSFFLSFLHSFFCHPPFLSYPCPTPCRRRHHHT